MTTTISGTAGVTFPAGIRTKYAIMQTTIDAATTTDQLKAVMPQGA